MQEETCRVCRDELHYNYFQANFNNITPNNKIYSAGSNPGYFEYFGFSNPMLHYFVHEQNSVTSSLHVKELSLYGFIRLLAHPGNIGYRGKSKVSLRRQYDPLWFPSATLTNQTNNLIYVIGLIC